MAIPFPAIKPSARSFTAADYPVTAPEYARGIAYPRLRGNTAVNAQLQLSFNNITDAEAASILESYALSRSGFFPLSIPGDIVSGIELDALKIRVNLRGRLSWHFSSPPKIDAVISGISNATVELTATTSGKFDEVYSVPIGQFTLNPVTPQVIFTLTTPPSSDFFDAFLYTGDGGTTRQFTQPGFEPGMVWYCQRIPETSTSGWVFHTRTSASFDGSNNFALRPRPSFGLDTSVTPWVSFDSAGFTLLRGDENNVGGNRFSRDFVAYAWKAGSAVTNNNDGSVTSKVSVSSQLGYSVVRWIGTGSSGATVGHGLGTTPDFMFLAAGQGTSSSILDVAAIGNIIGSGFGIRTSSSSARFSQTLYSVNSSIITLSSTSWVGFNEPNCVNHAIAFTSVPGFSKFDTYAGNGVSPRPITGLGFQPRMVIIKRLTGGAGTWYVVDDVRPYNLDFNITMQETEPKVATFDADGFTLDGSFGLNGSGNTYLYMAFGAGGP